MKNCWYHSFFDLELDLAEKLVVNRGGGSFIKVFFKCSGKIDEFFRIDCCYNNNNNSPICFNKYT